jgi:hypothetical protein
MTDPPRLFDVGNRPFEQALLGSAQQDRGSIAAQSRCVAAVGAAAFAATQVTTAVAATTTASVAGGGAVSVLALKGILMGLALGASVQGVVLVKERVSSNTTSHQEKPAEIDREHRAIARVNSLSPNVAPTLENKERVESLERRYPENPVALGTRLPGDQKRLEVTTGLNGAPPFALPENPQALSGEALQKNDLAREVALLEEARSACITGRFEVALTLVEQHRIKFANGALAPEALVIRVRALLGQNRQSEASAIARPFIQENPSSPVTTRLKILVGN